MGNVTINNSPENGRLQMKIEQIKRERKIYRANGNEKKSIICQFVHIWLTFV